MLTFRNLQDQVLLYLDQQGDTSHGLDLVKAAIQTAHEKRVMSQRWTFMLWPTPVSLTFNSGQRNYILHPLASTMLSDFVNNTAKQQMHETPTRARYKSGVQEDRYHFEFVADAPVRVQPAQGALTVAGQARITYVDQNGDVQTEDVVDDDTSGTVVEVLSITKLNSATLSITDVNAVNILSLSASEFGKNYPQIRLFDDGHAGEVGLYRFYKKPTLLSHDNDIPNIPYPFSRILVYDALLELYTYNDDNPPEFWLVQQANWELQMSQAYQEGEMEGSESRIVQEVDTYGG